MENDVSTLFARASALAVQADDVGALKQAFGLFSRAAQQGDGKSLEALAVMLENGQGVSKTPERAAELYGLAWQDGLPSAAYRLGCMIAAGTVRAEFEPEDRDEAALELFSDAAALGQPQAILALAQFRANGRGGPKDLKAARSLYAMAALRGEVMAALELAQLLMLDHDDAEAWAWLALGQRLGHAKGRHRDAAQLAPQLAAERVALEAKMDTSTLIAGYTRLTELERLVQPPQD